MLSVLRRKSRRESKIAMPCVVSVALFTAVFIVSAAALGPSSSSGADTSTAIGSLDKLLGNQANAVEAVHARARKAGVRWVVLMKGGPFLDKLGVRKVVIWNTAAKAIYGVREPAEYGRLEPGIKAIPLLDRMARESGYESGYREDVLYEFWKDIPMAVSMELDVAEGQEAAGNAPRIAVGVVAELTNSGPGGVFIWNIPGLAGQVQSRAPEGTRVRVIEGPVKSEGKTWWKVELPNATAGWVAEIWLIRSGQP